MLLPPPVLQTANSSDSKLKSSNRQSNIELLRIIAMFMILVRHAGFYALGMPVDNANLTHAQIFFLTICEFFCSVGVNVFILISGYFGIKYTGKGLWRFIFQCLFYSIGIFLTLHLMGLIEITPLGLAECFYLRKINWFPKAYLCLFIFAPILNQFVEHSPRKDVKKIVIAFLVFQTIFGCFFEATHFISLGYSTISFMGLYLIARYLKLYGLRFSHWSKRSLLITYLGISIILSIIGYICLQQNYYVAFYRLDAYCNPLVIASSLALFILFTKFNLKSRFVNIVASSCFAVYLFHSNPNIIERLYTSTIKELHSSYGSFALVYIIGFLLLIYIGAILLDKIRILIWNVLYNQVKNIKTNK